MNRAGFTLLELLIVLLILGLLLGAGVVSLIPLRDANRLRDAAHTITRDFNFAQSLTRKNNTDATVTIDTAARTILVKQGAVTYTSNTLTVDELSIGCRTECPTATGTALTFTFAAPHAALAWDVKVTLKVGSRIRKAFVLGQTAISEVRE